MKSQFALSFANDLANDRRATLEMNEYESQAIDPFAGVYSLALIEIATPTIEPLGKISYFFFTDSE